MKLTQASRFALRLTVTQNVPTASSHKIDKLVFPAAFLMAGIGVGVSSFSLKQLLSSRKN